MTAAPEFTGFPASSTAREGILPVSGTRRSRARAAASSRARRDRELLLVFIVGLVVYTALGWYGAYVLEIFNADGLARIAQAHGVIFSRDPHLGALGFVWPPLPALTNVPLVTLLKPLGLPLLAGPIMSAIYSALALSVLCSILKKFGLGRAWRLAWVVAFGLQEMVIHNATMGLSEAGFLAFLLFSLNGYVVWDSQQKVGGLIMAGFGAALAIYCRYEGLAWVAIMTVAIVWRLCLNGFRPWAKIVEGTTLAFAIPIAWALPIWMAVNWQIQGNPFYFLVGAGATSNTPDTAKQVGIDHPFYYAYGSLSGSASLLLERIAHLSPLLLAASAVLLIWVLSKRRWSALAYLAFAWSILGFTLAIAYAGILPPFSRYFFWAGPGGVIVAGATYHATGNPWTRRIIATATVGIALYSAFMAPAEAWLKLPQDTEQRVITAVLVAPEAAGYTRPGAQLHEFKEIAGYLNSRPPGDLTIVDASLGSPLVFFLSRPNEIVLATDRDFFPILRDPVGNVGRILVPYPSFDSQGRSDVLGLYPDLYELGAPWATLEREFPGPMRWRIYRVENP